MAISYISSGSGVDSIATMPTHQAGDLLLFYAFIDGVATPPSLPGDCTNIGTDTRFNTGARVAYKIAASSSETSGTWTTATNLIVVVYRDTKRPGKFWLNNGTGTLLLYSINSQTFEDAAGSAWAVGFAGHRSVNGSLVTPPTGMTNRTVTVTATSKAAAHDTNGTVTGWADQSVEVAGSANGWICSVVELVPFINYPATLFTNSNTIYAPVVTGLYHASATKLTNSSTLYPPVVSLQSAQSHIYINESVFFLPVVKLKNYVSAPKITNSSSIFAPFVSQNYYLSAPFLDNQSIVFAPVVHNFNYVLPGILDNQNVINAPSVHGIYKLSAQLLDNQNTIYNPVVVFSAAPLVATILNNSNTIYPPVVKGLYYASATKLTNSSTIYPPVFIIGALRLFATVFIDQDVFYGAGASVGEAPVYWRNIFIINENLFNNYSTLAASTEAVGFSRFNLLVDKKPYSWRSTTATDQNITITWAATQSVNSVALAFTNLMSGTKITVQCYTNSGDALPFFTTPEKNMLYNKVTPAGFATQNYASHVFGGGSHLSVLFPSVDVKKIRINISDTGNPDGFLAVGRVIIGDAFVPTINAEYGAEIGLDDNSVFVETEGGSKILNRKPMERTLNFSLPALVDAEKLRAIEIQNAGISSPVFVSLLSDVLEATHEEQAAQIYGMIESSSTAFAFYENYKSEFKIREI